MLSKIIKLEDIKDGFINHELGHPEEDMLDIALFMQFTIDILKNIIDRQEQLFGKVKKLEQEGSYFDRVENIKEVENLNGR